MTEHLAQVHAFVYRYLQFCSVLCWRVHKLEWICRHRWDLARPAVHLRKAMEPVAIRQPPGIPGYFRHLPAGLIFSPNSDPDPDLLS
jgi:hypothetical protein